jgi:uncharacterized protein YoaH (UPF0181 family)
MASRGFLAFLLLSLGFMATGFAQQSACKADVPVSVINASGDSFRGLNADDFSAHGGRAAVPIKSATLDDGPRRVLFVVDTGKKVHSNVRKAETEMVDAIMAAARPGDSFALVVTHGLDRTAKFGEDKAKFAEVLSQDGESKSGQTVGVLDAMMEGMEWFGAPASGDAIVVIAAELEGNHKANPKSIEKGLKDHHIRMFGLALGPVNTRNIAASGTMTSTTSQGFARVTPGIGDFVYNTGDENFFPLTTQSGGLVRGVLGSPTKQGYNPDDPKAKQMVTQRARQLFNMISTFYRIEVEPPAHPEEWSVDVVERVHKVVPQMWILYPHSLGPC